MKVDFFAPGMHEVADEYPPLAEIAHGLTFGEGPVWNRREGQLYYVDIIGDRIWRWQDGKRQAVTVRGVTITDREEQVFNLVLGCCEMFIAGGYLARSKPPLEAALSAQETGPGAAAPARRTTDD